MCILAVIMLVCIQSAGAVTVDIHVNREAVVISREGIHTDVAFPGASVFQLPGFPALPEFPVLVALPWGTSATGRMELTDNYTAIPGGHIIQPVAEHCILSQMNSACPPVPNSTVYGSTVCFPSEPVRFCGSGIVMGCPTASLMISPVRWNPSSGQLEILTSLEVSLETVSCSSMTINCLSTTGRQRLQQIVASAVVNPMGVSYQAVPTVEASELEYGEYIIISHPDYLSQAQELADWKTRKGIPANVYSIDWIASEYSGCVDLQQSVRAFLTDCRNEGAQFVLIFGDDDKIPARKAIVQYPPDTLYPPVDLYWADINDQVSGEDLWDSNENGIWGEYQIDQVDFHPDLFTGRASVNSVEEADIFIDKVFLYEGVASSDYFETAPVQTRMGYTTQLLWNDPAPCYGSAGAELISILVPTGSSWEEEKCYESTGNNSKQITLDMINSGPSHIYQAVHGSVSTFGVPGGLVFTTDVMSLKNIQNGGLPAIMNTIACEVGYFDNNECIADAWLASPGGGGFGGFNARYGWGNAYDPGNGACEIICRGIYESVWVDGQISLGAMHFMGRDKVTPPEHEVWDWCIKEYNLFGDPEMQVWSEVPAVIQGDYPDVITGETPVEISAESDGSPIEGALVCLWKGDNWQNAEIYLTGYTDQNGLVTMNPSPESPGEILLTISAVNHCTLLDSIPVGDLGSHNTEPENNTRLWAVSPNPSHTTATVSFSLATPGRAELRIFDLAGRIVAVPGNREFPAGENTVVWDLSDRQGVAVPGGLYCAQLSSKGVVMTEMLMVLR